MLILFAGRVKWGGSVCPGSPCPHCPDHMSRGQQQAVCFRRQTNARIHTYTHTHIPCTFRSQNTSKFNDRNSRPWLVCSLDKTKTMLLWNSSKALGFRGAWNRITWGSFQKHTCLGLPTSRDYTQDMYNFKKVSR